MGSSQSLTTFDMRGFHSLLTAWATVGALLRRIFAAGALAVDPVRRATEPWMFDPWHVVVRRAGQPFGAGRAARAWAGFAARPGIPPRIVTGDRDRSWEGQCWAARGRGNPVRRLRRSWIDGWWQRAGIARGVGSQFSNA